MKEKFSNEPDKRRHIKIGKNVYIVSESFLQKGKTPKEIIEKLILIKARKNSA
jgi:hypothetical protein